MTGRHCRTRTTCGPSGVSSTGTAATAPGCSTIHRTNSSPVGDSNVSSQNVRNPPRATSLESTRR